MSASSKAGFLYLLAVLVAVIAWFAVLLVDHAGGRTVTQTLEVLLTHDGQPNPFLLLIIIPTVCLLLAAGYFSPLAEARTGATLLFLAGTAAAIASWLTPFPKFAIFVLAPLWYGFLCARALFRASIK